MRWDRLKFQERLENALKKAGKGKAEIAALLGGGGAMISGWIGNKKTTAPKLDQLCIVAEALNEQASWLAFGEGVTADEFSIIMLLRESTPEDRKTIREIVEKFADAAELGNKRASQSGQRNAAPVPEWPELEDLPAPSRQLEDGDGIAPILRGDAALLSRRKAATHKPSKSPRTRKKKRGFGEDR